MAAPLQARAFVGPESPGHCQRISTLDLALPLMLARPLPGLPHIPRHSTGSTMTNTGDKRQMG